MGLTVVPGNMIEDGTVTDSNFTNATITSTDMALDPRNASNLSSGDVPAAQLDNVDLTGLEDDTALLGFKTAANGSLAKYNLLDQTVDAFEDATGVDASASTNEIRNSSGKYYSGSDPATGGTITTDGSDTIHTFTVNDTFVAGAAANAELLVVAGGGSGGGNHYLGGGGAGGYRTVASHAITAQSYSVTVGAGGDKTEASAPYGKGGDSVFDTITSTGGGHGGNDNSGGSAQPGGVGGSGGGGRGGVGGSGPALPGGAGNTPSTSPSQGNAGASSGANDGGGGGGGGAGGAGTAGTAGNGSPAVGGNGGAGVQNDITGTNTYYASGGGGARGYITSSPGTHGSGGTGWSSTGYGMGGGDISVAATDDGTAGVVIIRFTTGAFDAHNNMTLVSNSTAAQAAPTKGDMVMTYTNSIGTAVINTDITAEFSADNGSTWTAMTLASQGTTGGHTILSAHDVTRTSTSGTSMRYRIKTLNQSSSKATRIHAVSLGWS